MRLVLLLLITVALPWAWLQAEFRGSPAVRRTLGVLTILWSFGIAALIGGLQSFNANAYFTFATKELLQASIEHLRAGKTEVVLREWVRAEAEFHPTYENRAHYQQTVEQAIKGMKQP